MALDIFADNSIIHNNSSLEGRTNVTVPLSPNAVPGMSWMLNQY